MTKFKSDFGSRFRILKGGKISLIVSAMLMSASMVTSVNAATGDIVITNTSFKDGDGGLIYNVDEASELSWGSSNDVTFYNTQVYDNNPSNTNDQITSIAVLGTVDKTINLGVASNLNQFNLEGTGHLLLVREYDSLYTQNTTINNYGNLVTTSYTSSPTIQYDSNNEANIFNNYRTVTAADDLDSNGNVVYSGIAIENYSTNGLTLNNFGTINGDISSMNGGTFINNEGATINGNLFIANGTSTLENSGLVNLKSSVSNDNISYTNYIKTFTNKATGTLQINLDTDGTVSGTHYTYLNAGTATFEDGSTINVNVSNTSTNVGLLAGTTLNDVVRASNSLTINDTLNITDNSALLNFTHTIDGNTIDLNAVKVSTILGETQLGGGQSPAKNAAKVLDLINDNIGSYASMSPVITQLNSLGTSEQIAQAVESTTSQIGTAQQQSMQQISTNSMNIVMNRISTNLNSSGLNSGDEMVFDDKTLWVKPFGSIGSQENKDGMNGFDVKSYGIGMGIDGKNKDDQMVGFGLFLANANVDMNNVAQESDMTSYSAIVYGSLPVIDNKTSFLYQAGYGLQKTDSTRTVFTGDKATADFTSKVASFDAKLVRDYRINDSLLLQPMVSATYRNFKTPSYSETGAGALDLDVEKTSSSEMIVGLGTMAVYKLNTSDKLTGNINAGYDMRDDKNIVNSSYQGAAGVTFETEGIDNGRWSYDIGVGYDKTIDAQTNINFSYNLQGKGSDYMNNAVSLNYVYKF